MNEDQQELQNLLETIKSIEDEITSIELKKRLEELRERVRVFLRKQQNKIKIVENDIQSLKEEVNILKREKETVESKFIVAEITWSFDAHMARFVVDDPAENIEEFGTFRQMHDYLRVRQPSTNYWEEMQTKLSIDWSRQHESFKYELRKDRNEIAHPPFIADLDDLYQLAEFKKLSKYDKERMKDMVNMLKMAASLMKFGRTAASLDRTSTRRLFSSRPGQERRKIDQVLTTIISWDRNFEDIKKFTLQNIEHEKAKNCLQKYINDCTVEDYYFLIFDFIKKENAKRLGKLAWNIAERCPPDEGSSESEALIALQDLLYQPDEKVKEIPLDLAKLHIPDFLPKHLWKGGIKIVENYFHSIRKS